MKPDRNLLKMRPDDQKIVSGDPRGSIQPPERQQDAQQAAAANIARSQLDSIYSGEPVATDTANVYHRTHQPAHEAQAEQWKQYHSAWQDYYQKYYERYYVGAVQQVHAAYKSKVDEIATQQIAPTAVATETSPAPIEAPVSRDEAMYDLRSQLLSTVKDTGKKVRKSRHFIPITAAFAVLIIFSFLQYNQVIIANVLAYVSPGEVDPQNIVVDPNASLKVSKEPRLIIPKINVSAPVDYNAKPDNDSQMAAMQNGLAYFGIPGADSKPGQVGNTVIAGHSSNDFIESGNYKFVFALLDRMKKGDIFYLNYNGIRYTYSVTAIKVVSPTDVSSLVDGTTKPEATLLTCTPLGTSLNRLLVIGDQISPDPTTARSAPAVGSSTATKEIPGSSPTLLERVFGGN
jgi:sortase A